jgi:PII-like signaling protein
VSIISNIDRSVDYVITVFDKGTEIWRIVTKISTRMEMCLILIVGIAVVTDKKYFNIS